MAPAYFSYRNLRVWELEGKQKSWHILKDNWKLVSDDNEPWELYDISVDQTETNNVIEEYPDVAKELITDWESWINETDDTKFME